MEQLLRAVRAYFRQWEADEAAGVAQLSALFEGLGVLKGDGQLRPNLPPVVENWLDVALRGDSAEHCRPLLAALREHGRQLNWQATPPDYLGTAFAQQYAYAMLVGDSVFEADLAVYHSTTIAAGFSLQAPHTFYPPHNHKATEFYSPLSGDSRWQRGSTPPTAHAPGARIFHPSEIAHAMQTHATPMLTVWAWVGDLNPQIHTLAQEWL